MRLLPEAGEGEPRVGAEEPRGSWGFPGSRRGPRFPRWPRAPRGGFRGTPHACQAQEKPGRPWALRRPPCGTLSGGRRAPGRHHLPRGQPGRIWLRGLGCAGGHGPEGSDVREKGPAPPFLQNHLPGILCLPRGTEDRPDTPPTPASGQLLPASSKGRRALHAPRIFTPGGASGSAPAPTQEAPPRLPPVLPVQGQLLGQAWARLPRSSSGRRFWIWLRGLGCAGGHGLGGVGPGPRGPCGGSNPDSSG